jgi:5-methyltetrahydrofolate--homocysteine methyltransferase
MSIQEIFNAVSEYDKIRVTELVKAEIDKNTDISAILNDGLIAPLDDVGRQFSEGELFVPEMLRAAHAVKAGMAVLRPLMERSGTQPLGTVVIGTVKGDLHDIGKNLVTMMLEGGGFKVVDLGVDVGIEKFITAVEENGAQIVGMSALLTTTMPNMKDTVAAVRDRGLAVKTIIGGAPVNQKFADEIGADGYSEDAAKAVELSRTLLNS